MTTDTTAYRCQHYTDGKRCTAQATHKFMVDGHTATYAGYTCLAHGEQVCAEYASLTATIDIWTLEELQP